MTITEPAISAVSTELKIKSPVSVPAGTGCPIDHSRFYGYQKTTRVVEPADRPIERDAHGVWHVRDFELARAVLRSTDVKQAGFKAELLEKVPSHDDQSAHPLHGGQGAPGAAQADRALLHARDHEQELSPVHDRPGR